MSTLRERIVGRIGELRGKHSQAVFWRQNFDDLGSSEEVEGALRAMCDAGELRAYLGVYSEGVIYVGWGRRRTSGRRYHSTVGSAVRGMIRRRIRVS